MRRQTTLVAALISIAGSSTFSLSSQADPIDWHRAVAAHLHVAAAEHLHVAAAQHIERGITDAHVHAAVAHDIAAHEFIERHIRHHML